MSNQKGFSPILLIIVIIFVFLIVGTGYYLLNSQQNNLKNDQQSIKVSSPKPSDNNSALQTLNLKQLSFKIPKDWWHERGEDEDKREIISVNSVPAGVAGNVNAPALRVSFSLKNDLDKEKIKVANILDNSTTKTATIAGVTGVQIEGIGITNPIVDPEDGRDKIIITLLSRPEGIYEIENINFAYRCKMVEGSDTPQKIADYCTPIYNQILSSFSFSSQ